MSEPAFDLSSLEPQVDRAFRVAEQHFSVSREKEATEPSFSFSSLVSCFNELRNFLVHVLTFLEKHHSLPKAIEADSKAVGQGENEYRINRLRENRLVSEQYADLLHRVRTISNRAGAHSADNQHLVTSGNAATALKQALAIRKWLYEQYVQRNAEDISHSGMRDEIRDSGPAIRSPARAVEESDHELTDEEMSALIDRLEQRTRPLQIRTTRGQSNPREKNLQTVLADPAEAELFGYLLQGLDPAGARQAALARGFVGLASDHDVVFLAHAVREFSIWLPRVQAVTSLLDIEDIRIVARRNAYFHSVMGLNGPEYQLIFMRDRFPRYALRDIERFAVLERSFQQKIELSKTARYRNFSKRVLALCKAIGIEMDQYDRVFELDNDADRRNTRLYIEDRIRTGRGLFETWRAQWTAGRITKEAVRLERVLSTDRTLKRIDECYSDLMDFLMRIVSEDAEARRLKANNVLVPLTHARSYKDAKGLVDAHYTAKAIRTRWLLARQTAQIGGRYWNQFTEQERKALRENFNLYVNDLHVHGMGFWDQTLRAYIQARWEDPQIKEKTLAIDDI